MKNLLLVNPSVPLIWKRGTVKIMNNLVNPYSLSIIASILRKKENVIILDANILRLSQAATIKHIQRINPDIMILATAPMDKWQCPIPDDNYFLNILKKSSCEKIVLGPHVTMNPQKYTKYADKVIVGEPESHFPEIIDSNELIYHKKFADNLDSFPFPSYDLLPMKRYRNISVVTTRGCPSQCIFCYKGLWGNAYRVRSTDNVIKELKLLKDNYQIAHVVFWDLEFTLNKERVLELCERMIVEKLNITWFANARVSSADFEMFELMKDAGCISLAFGIETGFDKTLKTIKKGITTKQAREAVKMARKAGIKYIYCAFQIGFPNETYKDIDESFKFFKSIAYDNVFCTTPVPYPDTELNTMGKVGVEWNDIVDRAGKVGNNLNFKKIFFYTNLKLFLHKIIFGFPRFIRFVYKYYRGTTHIFFVISFFSDK